MTEPKQQHTPNSHKNTRLDLPFTSKRKDIGTWAYDHRTAILATVVAYVIFGVAFVAAEVVVSQRETQTAIEIDLTDLEQLQEELRRAQELNDLLRERYESVPTENKISNDELDENLDDHRTNAREIYDQADEVQRRMSQNAADYAAGLHAEQKILDQRYEGEGEQRHRKERGKVTVSYSLGNPVRHAQKMPVPAYMCEGGGEVIVNIVVNQNGDVVDAVVDDRLSEPNACLKEAALEKAKASVFNANPSAPARHRGSISYLFVSQ